MKPNIKNKFGGKKLDGRRSPTESLTLAAKTRKDAFLEYALCCHIQIEHRKRIPEKHITGN